MKLGYVDGVNVGRIYMAPNIVQRRGFLLNVRHSSKFQIQWMISVLSERCNVA